MTKARGLADLGNVYSDGALSNRNLVINGAMQVAQRTTSSGGVAGTGYVALDRWKHDNNNLGTYTVQQLADAPSGFANSLKLTTDIADAAPAAADYAILKYVIEGRDVQRFAKGTPDAVPFTLSFWVKSNVTGTYTLGMVDTDNIRLAGANYTVSVSGTWEYVSLTFPADTTGAFNNDNLGSLEVEFWLASGSNWNTGAVPAAWETAVAADRNAGSTVNLASTIGNYFQITGVQLELGDTATPFEHRSFGQELALCQRYYTKVKANSAFSRFAVGYNYSGVRNNSVVHTPVNLRTTPTLTTTGTFGIYHGAELVANVSSVSIESGSNTAVSVNAITTGVTTGSVGILIANNDVSTFLAFDAEL
jgi:hypothetical protein